MQLLELQQNFWRAVRGNNAPSAPVDDWLTGSVRQTAAERLAVYHHAFWQRQIAYLCDTFQRTSALLGLADAERLMRDYVEAHPGSDPCIERIGAGFAAFLGARSDADARAPDVARLEWAFVESLLAPDRATARELPRDRGLSIAACRFEFSPSLRTEAVAVAAFSWFEGACSPAEHTPSAEAEAEATVVFWRAHHRVQLLRSSRRDARRLELARKGASLTEICATYDDVPDTLAATRAAALIQSWFRRGWIASVI